MKTMKMNVKWLAVAALAMVLMAGQEALAQGYGRQRGDGRGEGYRQWAKDKDGPGDEAGKPDYCRNIPNLTEEQEAKIEKSWLKFRKESTDLRNQVAEKKARLRTLNGADKPDQKAIDQVIDEKAALKVRLEKLQSQHRQEVRSLLTEEQRVVFDSRKGKGRGGFGEGRRGGRHGGDCPRGY